MSRLTSIWLAASAFAITVMIPSVSSAYTCSSDGCPHWCEPVPFSISSTSVDVGEEATLQEVMRAMTDWTRVSCADIDLNYQGRSNAGLRNGDGVSEVGWIESGWPHGSGAIGVTIGVWSSGGELCYSESDMEMNGQDYTWTTASGRGNSVNLYSIALHEGGHYYGLGHSDDRDATMYFAYQGGIDVLGSDDQAGICFLYPRAGDTANCVLDGCPTGEVCNSESGSCEPFIGADMCAPCSEDIDCGGSNDFCITYPDGLSYCGKQCERDLDCGTGGSCARLRTGDRQCARVGTDGSSFSCVMPMNGCRVDADCDGRDICSDAGQCVTPATPTKAATGDACGADADCDSGLCLQPDGVCTEPCDWLNALGECPDQFYCATTRLEQCTTGGGICVRGLAGSAASGEVCGVDTDCESLFCADNICGTPCVSSISCDGATCLPTSPRGCGICGIEPALLGDGGVAPETTSNVNAQSSDGCGCRVESWSPISAAWAPLLLLFWARRRR